MDLTTTYLGLKLRTPLVPSASPLSEEIDNIKSMEDAGASAVVLYSLFEEQLRQDRLELDHHMEQRHGKLRGGADLFSGAGGISPRSGGISQTHRQGEKSRAHSHHREHLNGSSAGGWTQYAKLIQQAGADALELNIYYIPTDMNLPAGKIEQTYLDILKAVKSEVTIPVAVKLSPFFTNFANMAKRMNDAGADGLVLFNRFYQPDIDLETLEVKPNILLSTPMAMRVPLRWIAILYGRLKCQPGGHQRHPSRDRRFENAHGRRGRDHALLHAHPARRRAHQSHRERTRRLDGGARIRIRHATQGQPEPEKMSRAQRLRARAIHAGHLQLFLVVIKSDRAENAGPRCGPDWSADFQIGTSNIQL